jgi:DNA topoisomerase-1
MADRQRATAMYLIDRLALRAGNEKGEEEADTVGCCSLRLEHVTLIPPLTIELRFLGKDSIMYEQEVEVDPQVFKNIKIFKADPKTPEDDLFDRLTVSDAKLNRSSSSRADVRLLSREDCRFEQTLGQLHGGSYCQGVPNL